MRRIDGANLVLPAPATAAPTLALHHSGAGDPTCETCGGAGYYLLDVPHRHPDFGRLQTCHCRQALQRAALYQVSGLARMTGKTFETFDSRIPGTLDAFTRAGTYANELGGEWLVFVGGFGCGKTH